MSYIKTIAVIGGGAAGFFAAISCAKANPSHKIIILEKNRQLLSKVRISGGGRCNVTHACFEAENLTKNYPRGHKELRGAFSRFQPKDTVEWFKNYGLSLKTEADGRMFPTSDSSETIISCFLEQAHKLNIEIQTEKGVIDIEKKETQYHLTLVNQETLICDNLLIASGSAKPVAELLKKLGHTLIPPVPSLFTFNIPKSNLHALSGLSVPEAKISLDSLKLQQTGPLLITHWGFSGPAILKLSAWGARELFDLNYHSPVKINWLPRYSTDNLKALITDYKTSHPNRLVNGDSPVPLPKNLWKALLEQIDLEKELRWTALSKVMTTKILNLLQENTYQIEGKTTYKDEFVTSGGVKLSEVNFKTMESRLCPGLFFAGEVLDIDGITGGFNFQNAWTSGWTAAQAMASKEPLT